MKQIKNDKINETLYYEKLKNGLEVYLLKNPEETSIKISFATKYGSMHNSFVPKNKKNYVDYPNGIAHFLEHKLFEMEDKENALTQFQKKGVYVNAFTSKNITAYYLVLTENIEENVNDLLDFVQSPYFTDENVEKEKGIISEEIKMWDDFPEEKLFDTLFLNTFVNHPYRNSIAGRIKDIKKITKEDLRDNYDVFYHPQNMFVVVTGNFDEKEIIKIIKDNQNKKIFDPFNSIILKHIEEPSKVYKDKEIIKGNVEKTKIAINYKVLTSHLKIKTEKLEFYFNIILMNLFDKTSEINEKLKKLSVLTDGIKIDIDFVDNFSVWTIMAETEKPEELLKNIVKSMKNIKVTEEEFERKKKVLISEFISCFNDLNGLNQKILFTKANFNIDFISLFNLIEKLNYQELLKIIAKLDMSNKTVVILESKNS